MPSSLADEDLAHEIQALKIMQANLLDLAEQFCAMFIMQHCSKPGTKGAFQNFLSCKMADTVVLEDKNFWNDHIWHSSSSLLVIQILVAAYFWPSRDGILVHDWQIQCWRAMRYITPTFSSKWKLRCIHMWAYKVVLCLCSSWENRKGKCIHLWIVTIFCYIENNIRLGTPRLKNWST